MVISGLLFFIIILIGCSFEFRIIKINGDGIYTVNGFRKRIYFIEIKTGSIPLNISRNNIIKAAPFPPIRNTLVKPGFFEPCVLGSSKEQMYEIVEYTSTKLENNKPVHLLGIGDPLDIWNLVKFGIDTFDCVSPTRLARHGSALMRTKNGRINVKNSNHREDLLPIDENCNCITCRNYSKSYLHHLFKSDEMLGFQLITIHNIYFMNTNCIGIKICWFVVVFIVMKKI